MPKSILEWKTAPMPMLKNLTNTWIALALVFTPSHSQGRTTREEPLHSTFVKKSFQLMIAPKNERGGGADGGGGNLTQGRLSEEYFSKNMTRLAETEVIEILEALSDRISELEDSLPGFRDWLIVPVHKKDWFLDRNPLDEVLCRNANLHKEKSTVVACQDEGTVSIQESWYRDKEVSDKTKALLIVHELVRSHVMDLATKSALSKGKTDSIVAKVTLAIIGKESPESVYKLLSDISLLPSETEVTISLLNDCGDTMRLIAFLDNLMLGERNQSVLSETASLRRKTSALCTEYCSAVKDEMYAQNYCR